MGIYKVLALILAFMIGASIGSFMLVIIKRDNNNESWVSGRSHCDNCKKTLAWWELIPFFSYIFLGGKCSKCKKSIESSHFIVETILGIIYSIICYVYLNSNMNNKESIVILITFSIMYFNTISDFYYKYTITIPIYVAIVLNCIVLNNYIACIPLIGLILLMISGKNCDSKYLGAGDIDILILMYSSISTEGAYNSLMMIMNILIISSLFGIAYYLFVIKIKKLEDKRIPFVPCLFVGYIATVCNLSIVDIIQYI